ncbi:SNF2 family DNA or RNA helicase [Flavobacterium sp. CG_9.1]|uniref:SNF2-related protein n=1 Tax=Flavobacterium sp. CG_9.1 TaxID=2787728 RepID=UPI0018C97A29|nr:SNF2-related protein [Flavobacterium sp. CG_9.1]MBG6063042.1 SNF2 family DNA or RNA helicase [Flavobacterium sp. CG_9.1]
MELTDLKLIQDYLKENSIASSTANAKNISPTLINVYFGQYEFEYLGGATKPYQIEINIANPKKIESYCSCPYDHGGVCKHIIAALTDISKVIIKKTNSILHDLNDFTATQKLPLNQTHLENELLSDAVLSQFPSRYTSYYDHQLQISNASQSEVKTMFLDWGNHEQTISYDSETKILKTRCTCSKAEKPCDHIGISLRIIKKKLGENFFNTNYLPQKIEAFLKPYQITDNAEIGKIFDFQITKKGFEATSKYKNIQQGFQDLSNIYANEAVELSAKLPMSDHFDHDFGLGIYFGFRAKKLKGIFPFQAKYNKAKTDFASSISDLNYYSIGESMHLFLNENNDAVIIKSLQLNDLISSYESKREIGYLTKAFEHLELLLPLWKTLLIYKHEDKVSLTRKNLVSTKIEDIKIRLFFTLSENEYFYKLKAKIAIGDKDFNLNSTAIIVSSLFIFFQGNAYPIPNANVSAHLNSFANHSEINYFKKDVPNFIEKVILPLSKKFEIQTTIFKKSKAKIENESIEKQIYMSDLEGHYIVFKPVIQYGKTLVPVFSNELLLEATEDSKITYQDRNQSFEDNFIEEFRSLHPKFETQESMFFLTPEELFENYWMLHATERMKQLGITVFGANELKSFKFNLNKPVIRVNLKSDIDWFDIEIDISFGNQKVNIKELQKAFLKKSNYVALGDGTLGILPEEWMKKFANYFKTGEVKKNGIEMSNYQFGIIEELYEEMDTKPAFLEELYNKKMRLQNISEIETIPIPKGIKAKLRDYQHHGLNWLAFLDKNQLGGCLADDMGLGKTLQTIAFLQHLKVTNPKNQPSLIIAPTSLIFNWRNEIEKFCPTLKMLTFTGGNRLENKDNFNKYDLIISTYGSLLNDIAFLKDFKFNYIVLDESQAIKNPNSKRYKAVRLLNSYNRIALTGTPIENNTFDLYAQLNFLNPGLLGNMTHFKNNFSDAIDKEKDVDASQILSKIITPFMLRRTKEQVATELPEKTESIIFCEMEKEQRAVYNTFKNKYRDYLMNKIDENGVEKSQIYILEGLTKLRQICNSTALIPTDEDFGNYSVKLEALMENIKEKTGNHKILVFSQFVKMLQIVKTRLEEDHIHYEYLDGKTSNRQERVENFQNNADVRVFLISLKAGGTGLNLTEADYVFILDPWWNPAVENQAIDRCYRIGQTKKVMAYRMICKDTIEEKIVSLQQKKKNVASSIISIDDEKKSFDINEVKELFR